MSHKRLTTWQKATALVPLALLSGAWTTSLATTASASPEGDDETTTTLPDGTTVPDQALEAPASMTRPGSIAPGVPEGTEEAVVADVYAVKEKGGGVGGVEAELVGDRLALEASRVAVDDKGGDALVAGAGVGLGKD